MVKKVFKRFKNKQGRKFWNSEYDSKKRENLAMSKRPSGDLVKFLHWANKHSGAGMILGAGSVVYDVGCGNGRNLIYLAKEFSIVGSGFDISQEAINTAVEYSDGLSLEYVVHKMDGTIDLPDNSVDLILDMMASHFLDAAGRKLLRSEIKRVLKPGGWLFYKTFLLDEDRNAKKLLREYPAGEEGSYIHPKMGVAEHVSTVDEVKEEYSKYFTIHKLLKSHNHMKNGRPNKRRSVSAYMQL
ncbi:MAG: class I SAM-dependent methyltransferase [Candidatus Pacebacteria bacterium]|nr:class I SAM-dependent methyltransferase [Candidatus Paceibacterota bacterium]